jgi:hypothetical protein
LAVPRSIYCEVPVRTVYPDFGTPPTAHGRLVEFRRRIDSFFSGRCFFFVITRSFRIGRIGQSPAKQFAFLRPIFMNPRRSPGINRRMAILVDGNVKRG